MSHARARRDAPSNRSARLKPEHRTTAACPITDRCGGCSLQQWTYAAQLEAKRKTLGQVLQTLGAPPTGLGPVVGVGRPYGYRTKLLAVAGGKAGALRFGFYRPASTELVAAEGCPVQHPQTLSTLAMVKQLLDAHAVPPSRVRSDEGWLHGLCIRVDPHHRSSEVTLVGRTTRVPGGTRLVERLSQLPDVHGLHLNVSPTRSSYLLGETYHRLHGNRRTPFRLSNQSFQLSPGTFWQTCAESAEALVQRVLDALPREIELLADLYGGAGVFTRLTSGRWQRAIVAEANASAVADLRHWRGLPPTVRILEGRVESTIDRVLKHDPDVVILDPPRRGCHPPVISRLCRAHPQTIIYVSCGIDALLAEGRQLVASGYQLAHAAAVDMFPHTPHLEVIAKFVASQQEPR